MQIDYHKKFKKDYAKLSSHLKERVDKAIKLFKQNPFDPKLRNHKLEGAKEGFRSIDAAFDLRIIFEEFDGYVRVLVLAVGSHNQLY